MILSKMMQSLTSFPIEIQEMILSNLSGQGIVQMSNVCRLWHAICGRIAKEKFSRTIPKECIEELKSAGMSREDVWLTALNNQYLCKGVANNMLDPTKNIIIELSENQQLCFCVYGPLILIGCQSGEIEVYNPEESNQPVLKVEFEKSPISQLEVMTSKKLLLAKTGSIYKPTLAFFSLPYLSGENWVYKMTRLQPNIDNFNDELICEGKFSINGSVLLTLTKPNQVCVFNVVTLTKKTVEMKFVTNYIAKEDIGHVSLWQDEVIILFKKGEILRWCLSTQNSFVSNWYHEIHYANPVWIFQGRVFCSTLISSQLLGYWHMDTGAEYWLVGKPSCDLVRCRDFGTMFSADTGVEDVLCVCLKQRLLACGTRNGKILLYYLSDTFFSSEDYDINGNDHMTREFNRVPDLTIRTKERPLRNIQIQFNENCIKIYTWPYMLQGRPELKGLFQCITLKEGDWVEQSDRDFNDV